MSRFSRFELIAGGVILILIALIGVTFLIAQRRDPGPRIAYLGPVRGPQNVWIVDPTVDNATPQQVTFSENNVYDFGVSADGRWLAYAEIMDNGIPEIFLLDLQSGNRRQLTDCTGSDAYCTTPAWRADGKVIAYQRSELNSALGVPPSPPRIWLMDLAVDPPTTFPLFQESQVLGSQPQWSGDGGRLALYDSATQSILIYNFDQTDELRRVQAIPAGNGTVGALSPDGTWIAFPELVMGTLPHAVLRLANLETGDFGSLTPEDADDVEDLNVAWHPDGARVVITRQYMGERYTRGYQLYMVDVNTQQATPLIFDPNYQHSSPGWDQTGEWLAIHRFLVQGTTADTTPEIWVYQMETGALRRVVLDGFNPRWVN